MFNGTMEPVGVDGLLDDIKKIDTGSLFNTVSQVGTQAFSAFLQGKDLKAQRENTKTQIHLAQARERASYAESQRLSLSQQAGSFASGVSMPVLIGGVGLVGVLIYLKTRR